MQAVANAALARRGVKHRFNGNRKQSTENYTCTIHTAAWTESYVLRYEKRKQLGRRRIAIEAPPLLHRHCAAAAAPPLRRCPPQNCQA